MAFLSLPNEILCVIFGQKQIAISDLGHLMLTCKRFCHVVRESDQLWGEKFLSRYLLHSLHLYLFNFL